jgi:hypothetical protein
MNRLGGIAALLQSGAYLVFLVLVLVVLPTQSIQVADFLDPGSLLAKAAAHPQAIPVIVTIDVLNIGFGVFPFLVLLALIQGISQATTNERILVVSFVVVNMALFVAAGAIDSGGFPAFVRLYQQHAQGAAAGYQTLETVALQLTNAAAASYGVSILVMAVAAWRTKALTRPFLWLSLGWGAIAVLSWPFIIIGAVGPVVGIIWSTWTGILLLRGEQVAHVALAASGQQTN